MHKRFSDSYDRAIELKLTICLEHRVNSGFMKFYMASFISHRVTFFLKNSDFSVQTPTWGLKCPQVHKDF